MTTYGEYNLRSLIWIGGFRRNTSLWDAFCDCGSDQERFKMVDEYVSRELEVVLGPDPQGKSCHEAERARESGNDYFCRKEFVKALKAYTSSAVYAPWPTDGNPSSSSLALAFGNRSAVLFRTKRYAEAIADIDRALEHGYPEKSKLKLLLRKADSYIEAGCFQAAMDFLQATFGPDGEKMGSLEGVCSMTVVLDRFKKATEGLEARKTSGLDVDPTLKPIHPTVNDKLAALEKYPLAEGPNEVFTAASSLVTLAYAPEVGRHFVAAEDIPVGAVLIKDPCFVHALERKWVQTNCRACTMWTDVPIPCPGCTRAVYCSEGCAASQQAAAHAKECSFLWHFYKDPDAPDAIEHTLLVMRTLLKKTAEEWREFSSRFPGNLEGEVRAFERAPKRVYDSRDYDNVFCLYKGPEIPDQTQVIGSTFRAVYAIKVLEKAGIFGDLDHELRQFIGGLSVRHLRNYAVNVEFSWDWCEPPPAEYEDRRFLTGRVVHPTVELLNHGCDSNIAVARFADFSVVRAVRGIKKGEPLLRGFCPGAYLALDKFLREMSTLGMVGYKCQCRPCKEDWPTADNMDLESGFPMKCLECKHAFVLEPVLNGKHKCPECGWNALTLLLKLPVYLRTQIYSWDELAPLMDELQVVFEPPNASFGEFDEAMRSAWMCQGNKRAISPGEPTGFPPL